MRSDLVFGVLDMSTKAVQSPTPAQAVCSDNGSSALPAMPVTVCRSIRLGVAEAWDGDARAWRWGGVTPVDDAALRADERIARVRNNSAGRYRLARAFGTRLSPPCCCKRERLVDQEVEDQPVTSGYDRYRLRDQSPDRMSEMSQWGTVVHGLHLDRAFWSTRRRVGPRSRPRALVACRAPASAVLRERISTLDVR